MKTLIEKYLAEKSKFWAATTARSERYRLMAVTAYIDPGAPEKLWKHLASAYRPYTRQTIWVRVTDLIDWAIKFNYNNIRANKFREFRQEHKQLFRNSYKRSLCTVSFEEAKERIAKMPSGPSQVKAVQLLSTAMRFTESLSLNGSSEVVGKGAKVRRVYGAATPGPCTLTHLQFWRALKKQTGLKPHDLRKIALSKLVEAGANVFELQAAAGWTSIKTAENYINVSEKRLTDLFRSLK